MGCTGWFYDTRCEGDSCCQGRDWSGYGWCGTGSGPGDARWGRCAAVCDAVRGFDQSMYWTDAERAGAIGSEGPTLVQSILGADKFVIPVFAVIGVLSIIYFATKRACNK